VCVCVCVLACVCCYFACMCLGTYAKTRHLLESQRVPILNRFNFVLKACLCTHIHAVGPTCRVLIRIHAQEIDVCALLVTCRHLQKAHACTHVDTQRCMRMPTASVLTGNAHTLRTWPRHTWYARTHACASANTHLWLASANTHLWLASANTHLWLASANTHLWLRLLMVMSRGLPTAHAGDCMIFSMRLRMVGGTFSRSNLSA
jgi:hypothetical protein